MKFLYLIPALTLSIISQSYAQERAAGSALETQMTWTALRNMVQDANARSTALGTRVDVVDDRVDVLNTNVQNINTVVQEHTSDIQKILNCGKIKQVYNGTGCASQSFEEAKLDLKFKTFVLGNAAPGSPMVYTSGATVTTLKATEASAERRCSELGYEGFSGMGTDQYNNPGPNTNNRNAYWNGKKWVVVSAHDSPVYMSALTCYKASLK